MNPPTDWASAVAILVAGIIVGALLIYAFGRRKTQSLDANLERKDLEAKRDALIAQLRALPDDASDERARLERETAGVLRELDAFSGAAGSQPADEDGGLRAHRSTMNPTVKGFLWGASSVAALVALGYFVSKSTTPREQQQQPPMQSQQQQQDPAIQQLEASVQNDPNNLALRNDLAQAYLDRNNMMGVFEQSKFVLDKNPNDARALTLGAVVRMAMGEADTAQSMLQKATQIDPKNLDGWVALAWIYSQSGRMKDAEASIARAIQESPTNKARLEEVLQEMKSHATQPQPSPPAASSEMPPGHPPVGQTVRVTLQLDPAARVKSGIVYVIARSPQGGPPVAVRRLTVHAFPVTINFGANDSMLGQPLPPSFRLEARLDTDGDAATRTPTDPNAMQDGVSLGAAVTLALK